MYLYHYSIIPLFSRKKKITKFSVINDFNTVWFSDYRNEYNGLLKIMCRIYSVVSIRIYAYVVQFFCSRGKTKSIYNISMVLSFQRFSSRCVFHVKCPIQFYSESNLMFNIFAQFIVKIPHRINRVNVRFAKIHRNVHLQSSS